MAGPDLPGRGTAANPPNRYEPLHVELEPDPDSDSPPAPTVFYRDTSRTILAENDSPDIGFRFSLNPYRGCEHGCIYCAAPDAPILYADMAWRPIGNVCVGDVLFGFDEFPESGRTRKFRPAVVEAVWWSRRPTLRLVTERTEIVATAEHRWLQDRNFRWSQTRQLAAGRRLRYMPVVAEDFDDDYRLGYLAGFFDAEGHNGDSLRLSQVDVSVLERVRRYAAGLGFAFDLEHHGRASTLRLTGRLVDRIRFFSTCRPAILRKIGALYGCEMNVEPETVLAVEPGPVADVVDIQTSTGTFFAAGLATHNCYARPTHEYLGFSAGLDFERRIMVKENAPALLRQTLAAPRWEPQVVALSGNTDCYQPVERRLGITRRCLEVFAEFRNPVSAITKSALVARDADLFAELARHGAAHVLFSVTALDPELARRMEPRAARPERRLEAMAALARAGVPVGVLIGPVIPGLNDAEIPRILEAAARAGAQSASWVLLRLPKPVDELFERWLEERYPERRARVLARIRDTRGGRLSDSTFGRRQRGEGEYAEQIAALFTAVAKKHGLDRPLPPLSIEAFRRPARGDEQLTLL